MSARSTPRSRYAKAARAAHLARLAAAGGLLVLPAACGQSDAEVFATGPSTTVEAAAETTVTTTASRPSTTATRPGSSTTPTTKPSTTLAPATTAPPATATPPSGGTFPAGGELVVSFSFKPAAAGRIRNPYIAVWVEDANGKLVRTVSLWYEQSGKGSRWLNDLRSWYEASGGRPSATVSGATRAPGSYSVAWDGTGLDGEAVPAGNYVVFVEAAREHGPHGLTSAPVTIGADGFTVPLGNSGELSGLSAALKV